MIHVFLCVIFVHGRRGCEWYMCVYVLFSFIEGGGANGIHVFMCYFR